jgi:hypothetical protein
VTGGQIVWPPDSRPSVRLSGAVQPCPGPSIEGLHRDAGVVPGFRGPCGLGLTVLAAGLLRGEVLPWWVGGGAAGLGVAAMAVTMLWPDDWALYAPVFHLQSLWLAATGADLLLYGIGQGT